MKLPSNVLSALNQILNVSGLNSKIDILTTHAECFMHDPFPFVYYFLSIALNEQELDLMVHRMLSDHHQIHVTDLEQFFNKSSTPHELAQAAYKETLIKFPVPDKISLDFLDNEEKALDKVIQQQTF